MAYLDDHPPAVRQFRDPRRLPPSGVIVVHTAENTPDFVAFDGGAEAVARFIQGRTDPGSYHDLADSDSWIPLVRYECEAFHDATGSNPHSYGVSGATRADVWPLAPPEWRAGCVRNMATAAANYALWLRGRFGIIIPARRISRDESTLKVPGFISHAERDPTRRTDPGAAFPWDDFLTEFARLTDMEDTLSAADVEAINAHTTAEANRVIHQIEDSRPFFAQDFDRQAELGEDIVWVVFKQAGLKWVVPQPGDTPEEQEAPGKALLLDRVYSNGVYPNGYPRPWPRSKAHLDLYVTVGPVPPGWEPADSPTD